MEKIETGALKSLISTKFKNKLKAEIVDKKKGKSSKSKSPVKLKTPPPLTPSYKITNKIGGD